MREKPLILIVDDVSKNLQVLASILTANGYDVTIASNGGEALARARETLPDLICLDIMMPELDGFETCTKLKAAGPIRDIPVIFLTAKTEIEDLVRGFELGAADYVTKPFNSAELLARVRTHLGIRKSQEELLLKNKKLEELNNLKNEFLGMAAHDLRNPLAGMKNVLFVLLEKPGGNLTEKQRYFLTMVRENCDHMLTLLNELLDISAIESGELNLELKNEDYFEFLHKNIEINRSIASSKNISLTLEKESPIPAVSFDRNKLGQVIDNLVSNAIKYSYPNSEIKVRVNRENGHIRTTVVDQGQGIPAEELPNLFRAFQKTSVKATAGEKSTGLGLAITRKIIEGHGGSVAVESEVDKGSAFSFTLPVG